MVQRILHRAAQSEVKRADDNEATIKNRIHTFRTNTELILCQYGDKVKRVSELSLGEYFTSKYAFEFVLMVLFISDPR